ncbi:MAG: TonB-dependent siderophore receptor [Gammaproteobacteria bacterium]
MSHWALAGLVAAGICGACPVTHAAPSSVPPVYALSIRGQSLETALQEFARQSGVQVIFFSNVTVGFTTLDLSGDFTLAAAMGRLLASSGLSYREISPRTIEVRQSSPETARQARRAARTRADPSAGDAAAAGSMEEVQIVATVEQLAATRVPTPLHELPQTLSIVSREQMRQQNQFDLDDLLGHVPGVTTQRANSMGESFYSRAFSLNSFHVDGGGALKPALLDQLTTAGSPDLSEFDHVEVLRGSDALFSGNGNPGGTVGFVRKRPKSVPGLEASFNIGSWNNQRLELDVTGPIAGPFAGAGALRGRADVVYSRGDYFYDLAHQERKKVFAVFEYDLSPESTLTAGGSYQRDDTLPVFGGLPFYTTGRDAHLPRDTALTFDWAFFRPRTSEAYVQYRQEFADDWSVKFNATQGRTKLEYGYGQFASGINPVAGLSKPSAVFTGRPTTFTQDAADVTLTGVLDWFGLREEIALGADFTRLQWWENTVRYADIGPRILDVAAFDPAAFPDPRGAPPPYSPYAVWQRLKEYGAFASARIHLNESWSATLGVRVASDSFLLGFEGLSEAERALLATLGAFPTFGYGNSHIVTPLAALMYRIDDHYSWYASYADVYLSHAPSRRPDGSVIGASHGVTLETGIKGVWRDGALNGSLAVYRIAQRNVAFFRSAPDPPGCCTLSGTVRSGGGDIEFDGELRAGWLIGAGYTYNASVDADGGFLIGYAPRHLLKLWTSKRLPGDLARWTVGGSLRGQTELASAAVVRCTADFQKCEGGKVFQDAYAVLDLRTGFQIDPNWQIALSVNNVLDRTYYDSRSTDAHVWYGEPRNFMLRIDGKY